MEVLYLKWKDYKTGRKYVIGALCKEKQEYIFKLNPDGFKKSKEAGFFQKLEFQDVNKIYKSKELFTMFKVRVFQTEKYNNEQIKDYLNELNIKEYDEFEILRKTKGILMTDNFSLEEKLEEEDKQ